jgi:hypothetical protein
MQLRDLLVVALVVATAGIAAPLSAQGINGRSDRLVAEAERRSAEIRIDGRLDDADWERATPVRGFITTEPVEGLPASEDTEVRVLFDEKAIYIGARMYDSEPETVFRQLTRRDDLGRAADYFEVSLDSNLDRRTAYTFRVSAANVQEDRYRYDDTRSDGSWDAVWTSAVHHDSLGWTAELRIPLSQLRYTPTDHVQVWGANFARRRNHSNEKSFWSLESQRQHGGVSLHGNLGGIVLPRAPRALEIRPYTLARLHTADAAPDNPFFDGRSQGVSAGGDLRYGLGSTFVLDLTLNPDFGQVEVDPAVINLSAYEVFFPERRPFFSRDDRVFDFGLSGSSNRLFYSRRVGRAPQGLTPAGATFVDRPGETTILGAAKVTGRTAGGLTLGALAARTAAERGRAYFSEDDLFVGFAAEPASNYGVLRAQQDLRGGASQVGAILTAMNRDLPADGSLDWLVSEAYSTGVNFEHNWADRTWALWGFLAGSHIRGSTRALTRVQRSPNHFYQRPDAHYLSVDSAATSLTGAEWRLQFERRSGRHWTGALWAAQRTPGFEVDDAGFGRASERLDGGARITYQEINPQGIFLNYRLSAFTFHNWRHEALDDPFSWSHWWDRAHKAGQFGLSSNVTFLNNWGLNLSGSYKPEYLSDSATRGGPLMIDPARVGFEVRLNTDRRAALTLSPSADFNTSRWGGRSLATGLSLSWRPTSGSEVELQPTYEWQRDPAQYVAQTGPVGYQPTFGARYLFADLERRTLALPMRLNLVFSPTLTLQLFAQPLLSAGDFPAYKQLARAESFEFDRFEEGAGAVGTAGVSCVGGRTCVVAGRRYLDFTGDGRPDLSFADRDFNVRSLRGNSVLRWEYRPGSTLFVVWQQSRLSEENLGLFALGRDAEALLHARPENTVIVKVNYWLGL